MKAVYLRGDPVRPRRRMVLRKDIGGVVHWASSEHWNYRNGVSYCTLGALLTDFERTGPWEFPTCFWCIREATFIP